MAAPIAPLTAALAAWPDGPGSCPAARRATRAWVDNRVLSRFASPGEAARAVGEPGGSTVLAALAARRGDDWAAAAALAGLAVWVAPITTRWARAGMPQPDLEDSEADLLCGCLDQLHHQPLDGAPQSVVQTGWHRAHNRRRTERARADRNAPLTVLVPPAAKTSSRTAVEAILAALATATAAGKLPLSGAAALAWHAAGWTTSEVSARTGIAPATLRARRSRALRCLAASADLEAVA